MFDLSTFIKQFQAFAVANFFFVGFCLAVVFAFVYPFAGKLFYSYRVGEYRIIELINNCFVFFISGVTLKLEDLKAVLKNLNPVLYSLLMINFLTTLLSFGLIRLPALQPDFAIGLTIFCTVPTTLGVGVALTQLAKGDHAMSLFLTVISNLLGIVTVPLLLNVYLSHSGAIHIDSVNLTKKMSIAVLLPTVVGISTRKLFSFVPEFTKKYKVQLSLLSTFNLVMIVWMAFSSAKSTLLEQNVSEIVYVTGVAVSMHILFLGLNSVLAYKVFNFPIKQSISAIIMSSQKSSPVALAIITSLTTATPQQKGLFALPCIIGQLSQIFIGTFIVGWFAKLVDAKLVDINVQLATNIDMSFMNIAETSETESDQIVSTDDQQECKWNIDEKT